jgi:hypothetical protein
MGSITLLIKPVTGIAAPEAVGAAVRLDQHTCGSGCADNDIEKRAQCRYLLYKQSNAFIYHPCSQYHLE